MPKMTQKSSTAVAYAASLLELANEQKQAEPIAKELAAIRQIVTDNPSFRLFISDPGIGQSERGEAVKRIFGGKASPLMGNFLGVLNEKNRLGLLAQIADTYEDLLDEQLGKIEVDVTVAQKLDAAQLEQVRQRVSAALKKDAVVHQYVDDSIIGGLVLRVQDKLIDASVKFQLEQMRRQMLQASPR